MKLRTLASSSASSGTGLTTSLAAVLIHPRLSSLLVRNSNTVTKVTKGSGLPTGPERYGSGSSRASPSLVGRTLGSTSWHRSLGADPHSPRSREAAEHARLVLRAWARSSELRAPSCEVRAATGVPPRLDGWALRQAQEPAEGPRICFLCQSRVSPG